MKTTIKKLLNGYVSETYSFTEKFNEIVISRTEGYSGSPAEQLKSFFRDLQHGGCQSGMISDFIYNDDWKAFYIANIDDMEDYLLSIEDNMGAPIINRQHLPRYTFMCWVCFEEYCYTIYSNIFNK